jgi:hypothetical protein
MLGDRVQLGQKPIPPKILGSCLVKNVSKTKKIRLAELDSDTQYYVTSGNLSEQVVLRQAFVVLSQGAGLTFDRYRAYSRRL